MKPHTKPTSGEGTLLLWMLIVSLLAAVPLFFVFPNARSAKTTALSERPRIQWLPPSDMQQSGAKLPYVVADTLDPSLMSLPSARGFSRAMWSRGAPATHRPAEWDSKPAYLDPNAPKTMPPLLNLEPLSQSVLSATEKMPGRSEETEADSYEPPVAVNQSVFRVGGTLEARAVLRAPQLPTISNESSLRPTRVRIAVAADGLVRYATVERPSGNDAADARAVELVRQIRFEPQEANASDSLTWGVVRILWATEAPAATNGNTNNK
jgi:TonB family protein